MSSKLKKAALLVLILILPLQANPIVLRYFNEFLIDGTLWLLELYNPLDSINLDGYYLTSGGDTSRFKKGLVLDDHYLVISRDSLENDLVLNPAGDSLKLFTADSIQLDALYFASMKAGQSLSLSWDFHYLDNSPTIGQPNDTSNAMCSIHGCVSDTSGNPLEGIYAYWGYATPWPWMPLNLDSTGHYSIRALASTITFTFEKDGYQFLRAYVQAYPESTITADFVLEENLSSVEESAGTLTSGYKLSNNYPNPFNAITRFSYKIPHDAIVEVRVYDLNGRLVENLYSGFQTEGEYNLMWDAFAAPSGIYILRLQAGHVTLSKKCLLVK